MIIGAYPGSPAISEIELSRSHSGTPALREHLTLVIRTGSCHVQTYLDRDAVRSLINELLSFADEEVTV